jgi:hypothetical protein
MIKRLLFSTLISIPAVLGAQVNAIEEQFNGPALPAGWAEANMSLPIGMDTTWQIGYPANAAASGAFTAFSGGPASFISASFSNIEGAGTISNWLITPFVNASNGDTLSFYTRTTNFDGAFYPDRMQVRWANSNSTNVGSDSISVGDFSTLLLDINPTYSVDDAPNGGFPHAWTRYQIALSGLPANGESGRFAFRYFVQNGGPLGLNSGVIGIDDVTFPTNTIVGIEDAPKVIALTVSPNPVSDNLTINGLTGKTFIRIFGNDGKIVAERNSSATIEIIDVTTLSAGIYTVQLTSDSKVSTHRVVVQ